MESGVVRKNISSKRKQIQNDNLRFIDDIKSFDI